MRLEPIALASLLTACGGPTAEPGGPDGSYPDSDDQTAETVEPLAVTWQHDFEIGTANQLDVDADGRIVVGLDSVPADETNPDCAALVAFDAARNQVWSRTYDLSDPHTSQFGACTGAWLALEIDGDGGIVTSSYLLGAPVPSDNIDIVVRRHLLLNGDRQWTAYVVNDNGWIADVPYDVTTSADAVTVAGTTGSPWLAEYDLLGVQQWTRPETSEGVTTAVESDAAGGTIAITVRDMDHVLERVDAAGNTSLLVDLPDPYAYYTDAALALAPDGSVLVLERAEPYPLRRLLPTGALVTIDLFRENLVDQDGFPIPSSQPWRIATAPDGTVYVAAWVPGDVPYMDPDVVDPNESLLLTRYSAEGEIIGTRLRYPSGRLTDLEVAPDGTLVFAVGGQLLTADPIGE